MAAGAPHRPKTRRPTWKCTAAAVLGPAHLRVYHLMIAREGGCFALVYRAEPRPSSRSFSWRAGTFPEAHPEKACCPESPEVTLAYPAMGSDEASTVMRT